MNIHTALQILQPFMASGHANLARVVNFRILQLKGLAHNTHRLLPRLSTHVATAAVTEIEQLKEAYRLYRTLLVANDTAPPHLCGFRFVSSTSTEPKFKEHVVVSPIENIQGGKESSEIYCLDTVHLKWRGPDYKGESPTLVYSMPASWFTSASKRA